MGPRVLSTLWAANALGIAPSDVKNNLQQLVMCVVPLFSFVSTCSELKSVCSMDNQHLIFLAIGSVASASQLSYENQTHLEPNA
jgi:hypothetical protein